jgi:hypothetical protein
MSDLDYYDPLADERSYLPDRGETAVSLNARAEALNLARVQAPPPEKLLAEKIASLRLDPTRRTDQRSRAKYERASGPRCR